MDSTKHFESCLYAIPPDMKRILEFLPDEIKANVQEIRIRLKRPLALTVFGKPYFVLNDSKVSETFKENCRICEKNEIDECFMLITKHSVYAHTNELISGYIAMDFGHRAGICGTYSETGVISNISSINIRIARQITGIAEETAKIFDGKGILIAGKAGSGKTTMLRDLIRIISNNGYKTAVIDTRGEISASSYGVLYNDLGLNTDVLMNIGKEKGIEIALRTLFPDVICFDEIGNTAELTKISECFYCGVAIITTAHIGEICELLKRDITGKLLKSGAISKVVLMNSTVGKAPQIIDVKDLI